MTLELQSIDRTYLNRYVPSPRTGGGFDYFVRELLEEIKCEESVLDPSVIRAIPAEPTAESRTELVDACAL